jgi:hypothetical protein
VLEQIDPAGIAAFVAGVAAVIAVANSRPPQWGVRRVAFGVSACAAAIVVALLMKAPWLYAGLCWGGYQIYVGWAFVRRHSRVSAERHQYVTATARVLAYVALCDGSISPAESAIIRGAFERAGYSPDELQEVDLTLKDCAHVFAYDGSDPERLATLLKDACATVAQHSDNQTRYIFLRTALKIAATDGFVSLVEEKALRAATTWLGLTPADIDRAWSELFQASRIGPPASKITDALSDA